MSGETAVVEEGTILAWDSEFFGLRIARIEADALRIRLARVDEWCRRERVDCAYLMLDVDDQAGCDAAHAGGFRLVDVRVTLESGRVDDAVVEPGLIRTAVESDIAALKAIARVSHRATRFYADGRFPLDRCDALYELWIEKSCAGWADVVFVADAGAGPIGYLTCHRRDREGQIGLVGVDSASRGHGSGRALLAAAHRWFAAVGCDRVSVATQARNAPGLRLYQSAGMTVRQLQLWFHRWA